MEDAVITLDKLSKTYAHGTRPALDKVSLSVRKGEVYGYLGPNGAGKSTTIRLLLNFIQPTGGSATILGRDIVKDSVRIMHYVGYLSGDFVAYPKMTGEQFLAYMSYLHPMRSEGMHKKLAKRFNADLSKPIGTLSKGNRQKIGIIQAFMHEPDVLILDEPTGGLDPLMQEVFYDLVRENKQRGACVFVSSHNLAEVQKLCDRAGIIKDGKLISEKDIGDMELLASQTFEIDFDGKPPLKELKAVKGAHVQTDDGLVRVRMDGDLSPLFAVLAKNTVKHLQTRELNLEDEFMRYYEAEDTK